ncbi:MAG TPA: ABC transporter substrate-binding protein, partial [Reyranella sp.]|nr:ABC transporter substrate-binding protein [Reyranella sp.]
MISRRKALRAGAGLAAIGALGAPAIAHAQTKTLKITTWGGKWGDIMKATVLPAFEKEFKCTVSADQAFPFMPKLQASPKNDPLYDIFHTNSNEQWSALTEGLVMPKITVKEVPNVADVYPYAVSDKIVGVSIFTSAIGLGYRTDKGLTKPTSWKDLADPKLAGVRGGYIIPVNSLGQCHLMMLGKIYGKDLTDLDAAYKALEQLKPIKLVDFTG